MARELRQSTSVDVPIGPFLDPTDGVTPETTLTITQPDVRLKKNGGAWAQKAAAQTLSHEENGFYEVTLDATDTNTLGLLRLAVFESGSAPVWEDFVVVSQSYWDAKYSTGNFPAAVNTIAAGAITAAAIATGAIDADSLAADAVAEIADGVWDEDASAHQTDGTFGQTVGDSGGGNPSIWTMLDSGIISANDVATAVWDMDATLHQTQGTFGQAIGDPGADTDTIWALVNALPTAADNATAVLTTAMTEAYSTDGGTVTLAQALYELLAYDQESAISGTTMTVKKRDGTTTAMTITLDDAITPTAKTRSG